MQWKKCRTLWTSVRAGSGVMLGEESGKTSWFSEASPRFVAQDIPPTELHFGIYSVDFKYHWKKWYLNWDPKDKSSNINNIQIIVRANTGKMLTMYRAALQAHCVCVWDLVSSSGYLCEADTAIILVAPLGRLRGDKSLVQGHLAHQWQSQDWSPGCLGPEGQLCG